MRKWIADLVEKSEKKKTDRWYKHQPEWGTPEATKLARDKTPGQKDMDVVEHLHCGTPECCGQCDTAVKEDAMTAGDAGIPQDTKNMGPVNVTDRRYKRGKTILLKRFRQHVENEGK